MVSLTFPQPTRGIKAQHCNPTFAICLEKAPTVSFPPFLFPPTTPNFFLQFFPQLNCYPVSHAGRHPSVDKANKCSRCHYLLTRCMEEAATVSSCPISIPPNQRLFSQLLFSVGCAGHPPSINEGNKGLPPPSPPLSFMEKAVGLIFLLFFLPTIPLVLFHPYV